VTDTSHDNTEEQVAKKKRKKKTAEPVHGANGRCDGANELLEMNAQYCVVQDGGKVDVLMFERVVEKIGDYKHERLVPTFLTFQAFRNKYCNRVVFVTNSDGGSEPIPLGKWWLNHPERRQYDGLVFQPNGPSVINNHLNLWRGWGVAPQPGDWSLMQKHIKVVLASNDEDANTYILNQLAFMVQKPEQRAEVAIVFRGKRGTGKGTLGNAMVRIFGNHGVHLSDAKHLVGHFNSHLRNACCLFADEAYWPGDKSAEGNLKRLITEPTLAIEGKGRDVVFVPNMLHLIISSNEDWVVPAGEHERRYVVFNVLDTYMQKAEYFDPLYKQLEDGGHAAMLHDLLQRDITGWHPRQFPKTAGLLEQQQLSLEPLDAWWVELLESGMLEGADPTFPSQAVSGTHDRKIPEAYGGYRYVKQPGLYDQARASSPRRRNYASDKLLGDFLRKQGCVSWKVLQRRGWRFPDISESRSKWEERYPKWPWRDPDLTEWQAPPDPSHNE
jgi:hypothetical protein